jgi:hypothetical protein
MNKNNTLVIIIATIAVIMTSAFAISVISNQSSSSNPEIQYQPIVYGNVITVNDAADFDNAKLGDIILIGEDAKVDSCFITNLQVAIDTGIPVVSFNGGGIFQSMNIPTSYGDSNFAGYYKDPTTGNICCYEVKANNDNESAVRLFNWATECIESQ